MKRSPMRRGKGLQRTAMKRGAGFKQKLYPPSPMIDRCEACGHSRRLHAPHCQAPTACACEVFVDEPKLPSPQRQRRAAERREWAKAKKEKLAWTPDCEVCWIRTRSQESASDVHHKLLQSQGGTHEQANLLSLCRPHHDLIHNNGDFKREAVERGWIRRRLEGLRSSAER